MKKGSTLRIGIIGVGHLGYFHLKQIITISNIEISGIYDNNKKRAEEVSSEYDVKSFSILNDLLISSDAVSIVTPTPTHYKIASLALSHGCHVFIEKPITNNIIHANKLLKQAKKEKKIIQVGHIERFNPGFLALKKINPSPKFIEVHRLAPFNPRGNDVPVVLDLMIHDIDIIISLLGNEIIDTKASGVKVVSSSIDIANVRMEFANGCIVNLTASRISQKEMRKMRLFSVNGYITIDFKEKILEEYQISNKNNHQNKVFEIGDKNKKYIIYNKPKMQKKDALKMELNHFIDSILNNKNPETDGYSATEALKIALNIQSIIDEQ
tara:strand:- start:1492 stop:2466 length:975 start_codon:yes stop_codon:yes gene_type:complete